MTDAVCFNTLFDRDLKDVLEKIFIPLDNESLKNCLGVCHAWQSLLTSDDFQKRRAAWRAASFAAAAHALQPRELFVDGLGGETGEEELAQYFAQFGEVESVDLKLDRNTGLSRCFAFVAFKDPTGALTSLEICYLRNWLDILFRFCFTAVLYCLLYSYN